MEGRFKNMFQWLDEFLLHAINEDMMLGEIENFFKVCSKHSVGFKTHAGKSNIFMRKAIFWGRKLSEGGIQYDPRQFDALMSIHTPSLAGELQQLICATNWMRC